MASADGSLPSPGHRNLRRLLQLRTPGVESADQNPLTSLSSSRPPPQEATTNLDKRKSIASQTFLGLGCSSSASSQVCAPGAAASTVRSSADWQGKRTVRRSHKNKKKERRSSTPVAPVADVWCSPGIALVAVDDSVDCVVSQRDPVGRGFRRDNERISRERTSSGRAFSSNGEQISLLADSFSSLQASLIGSDLIPSRHYDHVRGYCSRPPVGLQEELNSWKLNSCVCLGYAKVGAVRNNNNSKQSKIHMKTKKANAAKEARNDTNFCGLIMLLENRISFGRGDSFDQYRHWRLDVDNMTYEELLELGDKIGHVSTGLMEEEIACSIRKAKHTMFDRLFSNVTDRKCSICQEEFEMNIEVGKLGCGHSYHPYCIKKWLLQKNACPVCKTSVTKT